MSCYSVLSAGVAKDCANMVAAIGVEKDLTLVKYEDFDKTATLDPANREADNLNGNMGGLTSIKLKSGAEQFVFEGTDYSVVPTVTPEVKEDGEVWYSHSILFIAYSKTAETRKIIESLGHTLVIAIVTERSTGLYELFGMEQGLKLTGLERQYTGAQTSNFYSVTISTPDIVVLKESTIGELAVGIDTPA